MAIVSLKPCLTKRKTKKTFKLSFLSVVSLVISIIATYIYYLMLHDQGNYYVWFLLCISSLFLPVLSKLFRSYDSTLAKVVEVIAIIIGSINFFSIIYSWSEIPPVIGIIIDLCAYGAYAGI